VRSQREGELHIYEDEQKSKVKGRRGKGNIYENEKKSKVKGRRGRGRRTIDWKTKKQKQLGERDLSQGWLILFHCLLVCFFDILFFPP
jgi:hypothetical protein